MTKQKEDVSEKASEKCTNQEIQEQSLLGNIKINNSVIASIVRIAALEIDGVYSVGTSFVEGITEIFSKKESERGVKVTEDESGKYSIEVRVILAFGIELAKVAVEIQKHVNEQVSKMTMKEVANVDVVIDGVKLPTEVQKKEQNTELKEIL